MSPIGHPKTFEDVASISEAQIVAPTSVTEDITAVFATEVDTSPFEGLISRPLEPIGSSSLFFSPSVAQYVISTLLLNLMAEASDMVWFVNETFQCLDVYNLDFRKDI